ncbi:MAG: hypothetical protein AAF571_07600 [Verrucomicrobiota bacterium]
MQARILILLILSMATLLPHSGRGQSAEAYRDIRSDINDQAKSGKWQEIRHKATGAGGSQISCLAYVEAYVIQKLVYVDSTDDDNETISLYFWQDGVLVSVYRLYKGTHTETHDLTEAEEIFNFDGPKLVGWYRTQDGWNSPSDTFFQQTGESVQREAIERSQPIYDKIQAD